jgi:ABC-2 type transport system ATP-binding protein/lipopolysaccharide transport system ATP-binding protein
MPIHTIEVEHLAKRYMIGSTDERSRYQYRTLRESVSSLGRLRRNRTNASQRELWAVNDVSFAVEEGEIVAVIGRNGAGKTTLLRILARITQPTRGISRTRGRVGSLLEIGTGFHPELTGSENIFLNGAVLGMSRADIRRRFDEIAAFSGVERHLSTPLKRYSAGMQLRLAFAVAAHLEPDMMLVDEVLAVGDAEFQRKCLGKISELTHQGRTAVFVSHDLGAVSRLCQRALWLEHGEVASEGPTAHVVDAYLKASLATRVPVVEFEPQESVAVQLLSVAVTDSAGKSLSAPRRDEALSIRLRLIVRERVPALDLSVYLLNQTGVTVLHESWSDARSPHESADLPGEYDACLTIPPVLPAGEYLVCVWIGFPSNLEGFETLVDQEALKVEVLPRPDDLADSVMRDRVAQPRVSWQVLPNRTLQRTYP